VEKMKMIPISCPWCDKEITEKGKGLIPLTIHLTKHNKTELSMLIVDWMCNGIPKKERIK